MKAFLNLLLLAWLVFTTIFAARYFCEPTAIIVSEPCDYQKALQVEVAKGRLSNKDFYGIILLIEGNDYYWKQYNASDFKLRQDTLGIRPTDPPTVMDSAYLLKSYKLVW